MILTAAVFLTALGFVTFVVGNLLGYQEIALIGGVLIFGVGFAVSVDGVSVESGEVKTEVDNSTIEVEHQYQQMNTPDSLPVGLLVMLVGGTLSLRALNEFA